LTAEEIKALLSQLDRPYYVMAFLAAIAGLRVSELRALKWADVDFAAGEMNLIRAIVCQRIGSLKTEASQKPIPMDAGLSALLLDWRKRCPYNQDSDYVFGSPEMRGTQPLWPSSAMFETHPTLREAGWNYETCSLARIPALVRNNRKRERWGREDGRRVTAARRQQNNAGYVDSGAHAGEKSSVAAGYLRLSFPNVPTLLLWQPQVLDSKVRTRSSVGRAMPF
jgi:hypothetical protein